MLVEFSLGGSRGQSCFVMVVVYLCTWVRCLHFLLLCMCGFACFRMFVFALVVFVLLQLDRRWSLCWIRSVVVETPLLRLEGDLRRKEFNKDMDR